jgi:hypothetical protein
LGHQVYVVGRAYHGQDLTIRFEPDTWMFRFALSEGTLISQQLAQGLSRADLLGPELAAVQAPAQPFQFALPLQGV